MPTENPPDDLTPDEEALLGDLSHIARSITSQDRARDMPPPDIWEGIAAEVDSTPLSEQSETDGSELIDLSDHRAARAAQPSVDVVPPVEASRQRTNPLLLVAAAIVALVVIGGAAIAVTGNSDSNPVYAAEISNADLPESFDGTATATVEFDDNPMLVIDFDAPLPTDEPVELWVLTADASDLISLGIVESGETSFAWPEGIEPADFPLVDLSIEPDDGDATHSGRSILRGALTES